MATPQRYPLSTADGGFIPLDVVSPLGVIVKNFLDDAAVQITTIPDGTPMLLLHATEDCTVEFADTEGTLGDGTVLANTVFVPAGLAITLAPPSYASVWVKGIENPGRLVIQLLDTWVVLALETQIGSR